MTTNAEWWPAVANHLWQSTLCVGLAAALTWLLQRRNARLRYAAWLTASVKFLVPAAILVAAGAALPRPAVPANDAAPDVSIAMQVIGEPFAPGAPAGPDAATGADVSSWSAAFGTLTGGVWVAGVLLLFTGRVVRWRRLRARLHAAAAVDGARELDALTRACEQQGVRWPVALLASGDALQPGVVGILRPVVLWPTALSSRLSDRQLDAIFAHEVAHIRRRDNLALALHRVVELVFWFYPVVWWLETRLLRERERACDEAVLELGHEPRAYARGILKVSTFCLQAAPGLVAGAAGANLTKRLEDIMRAQPPSSLGLIRRLALATAALTVLGGPIATGYLQAAPSPMPSAPGLTARLVPLGFARAVTPFDPPAPQTASRVSGVVTDERGAAIAEATVSAAPMGGGAAAQATTDANGRYVLALLPAQYELRVAKPGFRSAQSPLFVSREAPVTRDVQLTIGAVIESINVVAADPAKATGDYLDAAKAAYEQGRLAEAERFMTFALAKLRAENSTRRPAATASTVPPPPASWPSNAVRVGGDVKAPKKIKDVRPIYSPEAMANAVQGIVILETVIGQDGSVRDARVLRGHPLLNQAALDAVLQWQFTPTLLNGAPVDVLMTVTVNFTLQ